MPTSRYLKSLIIAAILASASISAAIVKPTIKMADTRPKVSLEDLLPRQFSDWQEAVDQPVVLPSADVQARLDKVYNQVVSRTYVNGQGYRIMLSVAYGGDQSDALTVHRPEWCYPAQGFEVSDIRADKLNIANRDIPVTRLRTRLGSRVEPVTYWIVNGDEPVSERFEARLVQLKYGFRGIIPDGMLVRLSSIDRDATRAFAMQDSFSRLLLLSVAKSSRARFGVS